MDDKTSDNELDFYFFQMHDFDGNGLLDGLEMMTALNHVIDEGTLKANAEKAETTTEPPEDHKQEGPIGHFALMEKLERQKLWENKFNSDSRKKHAQL